MAITLVVKNGTTLIDEDMLELVKKYNWYVCNTGYVKADFGHRGYVYLHRLVFHREITKRIVDQLDHINRNKLDNQKENLRIISHRGNQLNRSTPVKGYYYREARQAWVVRFKVNGVLKYYGHYATEEQARLRADSIKEMLREAEGL